MHISIRKLLRPFYLVPLFCCLVLLLMFVHLWKSPNYNSSVKTSDDLSRRIAQQLRADQGDLTSINQHVFNAYFDTRSTLGGRQFVRVITVLDTEGYRDNFICQFMHHDGVLSFSTVARKSKVGAGLPFGNHNYQEFVLSCPISKDLKAATFVFIQTEDGTLRSQVIRVRHNPLSLGVQPAYPKLVINCVSMTFGNPSAHRLIEWLEAQRLLKVDKVELHFHRMMNKEFESVAQAYSAEGFVNIRRIGCPFCEEAGQEETLGLLLMSPAINQCFYENLGAYKYTAVFDLDEIIVPQRHPDYPSLLRDLEKQVSTNSFAFGNWYHFSELGEDASVPEQLYMLRHPFRIRDASPMGDSAKSIHKSSCVMALHNHFSWEDVPQPATVLKFYFVPLDVGVNEHYKKCHLTQMTCEGMTREYNRMDGSRLNLLIGRELTVASLERIRQLLGTSVVK